MAEQETDKCIHCGQSLSLASKVLEEQPLPLPGGGEICPACYNNLTPQEYLFYFGLKN